MSICVDGVWMNGVTEGKDHVRGLRDHLEGLSVSGGRDPLWCQIGQTAID